MACKGYVCYSPKKWVVKEKAPYHRCTKVIDKRDLLGRVYLLVVPKSYRGLLEKSSRRVPLVVLRVFCKLYYTSGLYQQSLYLISGSSSIAKTK